MCDCNLTVFDGKCLQKEVDSKGEHFQQIYVNCFENYQLENQKCFKRCHSSCLYLQQQNKDCECECGDFVKENETCTQVCLPKFVFKNEKCFQKYESKAGNGYFDGNIVVYQNCTSGVLANGVCVTSNQNSLQIGLGIAIGVGLLGIGGLMLGMSCKKRIRTIEKERML